MTPPDKSDLLNRLQTALELELATIPPYLVALLSIKLPTNREAADRIRTVVIEEMLHLALVANVINALGGSPRICADAAPVYPLTLKFKGKPFADRSFPIALNAFSEPTVRTFLEIEKPEWALQTVTFAEKIEVPAPTIGHFYQDILASLDTLARGDPKGTFSGDPERQLGEDFYWSSGGEINAVTDLASAKAALSLVIDQGEGAWGPSPAFASGGGGRNLFPIGHFYRFNEILERRCYQRSDDPKQAPTGDPISIHYSAVFRMKDDARSSDYPAGSDVRKFNDRFNAQYSLMLQQIEQAFNGEPRLLYTAIMNGMHDLSSIARTMMQTAIPNDPGGRTACPTFEWVEPA